MKGQVGEPGPLPPRRRGPLPPLVGRREQAVPGMVGVPQLISQPIGLLPGGVPQVSSFLQLLRPLLL